ncbi:HYD1 signature containing ADP-ribosyltransferase family protein [Actinomadura gamaensis]|uniref:HYD1 signature containing ADP-ribosyltransferase family protein n=1 Tax=Actinomadura gamaensis TaxID=1763541 RepID=A0ABV9UDW1_9ACTN
MKLEDYVSAVYQHGGSVVLWHYTDSRGLRGICESGVLLPSLREVNPKDARYGDGQYFTDIPPWAMSLTQLSRRLVGVPWLGRRFTRYVGVDVTGLVLVPCRESIILVRGREPLVLDGRIVCLGANEWSGT